MGGYALRGYFVTGTGVTRDLSREAKGLSAIQTGRHLFGPDTTLWPAEL